MDRERDKIRERSAQQDEPVLLLEKGRRGLLNLIFGRTIPILLMIAVQVWLIVLAFRPLQRFVPYFYGVLMVFYGALILHLVNKPKDGAMKITWILLMVITPPVGVLLYLFVELDVGHRMLNRRVGELVDETARHMPQRGAFHAKLERENPELAALAHYTMRHGNYPAYDDTAVTYYPSGEAAMEGMIEALERAEKFIFLEFFIIDEGTMWGRVLRILEEKVKQGVEVRVLYDGTCALFRLPYRYPQMLSKLGVRCKMFSPLRPMISTHYNNRDHRKILVVDGKVAFTGGVNLADEYINQRKMYGHWKDVAIRLEGEAVRSFTMMFLQSWNITEEKDDFHRYLSVSHHPEGGAPGCVLPYGDSPLDDERVGEMVYLDVLNRAQRYVHIMTPYLILDEEMTTALTFAAKRGVDVAIMLPHIPDKRYAFALARSHYRELLSAGVRILEYTPGFVHAKVFVSDDEKAVVGTINLDYRSLYLHFECAAMLCDLPAVAAVEADFQATAKQCQEIHLEDLRHLPLGGRVAGWLLKVLAPLM